MPAYINFVCENSKICKKVQPVGFSKYDETWGDLISALKNNGWKIEGGPNTKDLKVYCSDCKK